MSEKDVVFLLFVVDLQEHLLFFALELPQSRVPDKVTQPLLVVLIKCLALVEVIANLKNDTDENGMIEVRLTC